MHFHAVSWQIGAELVRRFWDMAHAEMGSSRLQFKSAHRYLVSAFCVSKINVGARQGTWLNIYDRTC
jgi:hypothetical protein